MDELTTLAMTGATTIMAAMATSAWGVTRDGALRLFRRSAPDEQRALEAQLEREAAVVRQDQDPESARQDFAGGWRRQLVTLMREHPEAEAELRALVASVQAQLPQRENTGWIQINSATNHGTVFSALGGNVNVYQSPAAPPPAPGRANGD